MDKCVLIVIIVIILIVKAVVHHHLQKIAAHHPHLVAVVDVYIVAALRQTYATTVLM